MEDAAERPEFSVAAHEPATPGARVLTGSGALDAALGGGLPPDGAVLVQGDAGAGGVEFCFSVLLRALQSPGRRPVFLTALRSQRRARLELARLFPGHDASRIAVEDVRGRLPEWSLLPAGAVIVLESAASLARAGQDVADLAADVADAAAARGSLVLLVHTTGALPAHDERALAEACDGVLRFSWLPGSTARRRMLSLDGLRGLAPALEQDQVPSFEVLLERDVGVDVARVTSVA